MKKMFALGIVILVLLASLTGCDKEKNISFVTTDVEKIEVFTGSVPAQAMKKIVTDENDISKIINGLNALTIVRAATNDDLLTGGIGTKFLFHLTDGSSYTIHNNGNLVRTADGLFVVKGTSLDTEKFWNSLSYEVIGVTESELPIIVSNNDFEVISHDKLRGLAAKGDSLLFEDFRYIKGVNLSSRMGYYMMVYSVEGGYRLCINSDGYGIDRADLESIWENGGSGIDIRYNDVDEFIRANPSSPALTVEETQTIAHNHLGHAVIYLDTDWWEYDDEFPHHSKDPAKQALSESVETIGEATYQYTDNSGTFVAIGRRYGTVFEYNGEIWTESSSSMADIIEGNLIVERIEVFTGSVPAQAVMKIVTNEDDVKRIINGLNALTIEREAAPDDLLAGGIGTTFRFHLSDGSSYAINNHGNLLRTADGLFVVKGTSLNTDIFWNSLNYEEVRAEQSDLPKIN